MSAFICMMGLINQTSRMTMHHLYHTPLCISTLAQLQILCNAMAVGDVIRRSRLDPKSCSRPLGKYCSWADERKVKGEQRREGRERGGGHLGWPDMRPEGAGPSPSSSAPNTGLPFTYTAAHKISGQTSIGIKPL